VATAARPNRAAQDAAGLDPVEAETVRIYAWRIAERIGCQVIADRLNTDLRLTRHPAHPT
jgi:hypothetical protein